MAADRLAFLEAAVAGRGVAAAELITRQTIPAAEQETLVLRSELINDDGSLNVYDDVLKLFRPTYHKNKPAIQCVGWVGYIPLNDHFALEVSPRVPIGNLERLVGLAKGYTPNILIKYARTFAHATETPASLVDILTDQLLDAFDHIWEIGLLKTYDRVQQVSSSPAGRILPFESEWNTARLGRPVAASIAFRRTPDFTPNRVLRFAFEKLLARYLGSLSDDQRSRTTRLRKAMSRLEAIGRPSRSELTPASISHCIRLLPVQHEHYADALMVAQLIIFDVGLSIRSAGGAAILPSILIDMSKVFEEYMRVVLARGLSDDPRISVRDGNKGGDGGARTILFDPVRAGLKNPPVTPDIVINVDDEPKLIIDAKYKSTPDVPDRPDINQVVLYGAKYSASQVMLLHADRKEGRGLVELCGDVGAFKVYNGQVDLEADDIEAEEASFVAQIRALLASD